MRDYKSVIAQKDGNVSKQHPPSAFILLSKFRIERTGLWPTTHVEGLCMFQAIISVCESFVLALPL